MVKNHDFLICVRCAKHIEPSHRYRLTEERLVVHVDCLRPREGAPKPAKTLPLRAPSKGRYFPERWKNGEA